mgnify:CR=1 FL=1
MVGVCLGLGRDPGLLRGSLRLDPFYFRLRFCLGFVGFSLCNGRLFVQLRFLSVLFGLFLSLDLGLQGQWR